VVCDIFSMDCNHHPAVTGGVCAEEATELLQQFFRELRVELRSRPKWRRPVADN
jgi:hypothetical protein